MFWKTGYLQKTMRGGIFIRNGSGLSSCYSVAVVFLKMMPIFCKKLFYGIHVNCLWLIILEHCLKLANWLTDTLSIFSPAKNVFLQFSSVNIGWLVIVFETIIVDWTTGRNRRGVQKIAHIFFVRANFIEKRNLRHAPRNSTHLRNGLVWTRKLEIDPWFEQSG